MARIDDTTSTLRSSLRSHTMFMERYSELVRPGGKLITVIDDTLLSSDAEIFRSTRDFIVRLGLPKKRLGRRGVSGLNIRFVGAADLSDQSKSSLAEVIERIQDGVVQVTAGSGSGSGFIIDEGGVVVTNEHVVRGRRTVGIWLTNGRRYEGEVLARDSTADLALVQIESNQRFHAIVVGNPDDARVGDEVLALGFPLAGKIGNSLTVTRGIISSKRTVDGVNLLQTDAAINPGNSGGPLINEYGQVIGVNAFRIEETTGGRPVTSIGFAVSVIALQRMVPSTNPQLPRTPSASVSQPTMTPTPSLPATATPSATIAIAVGSISSDSPNISSGVEHTCMLRLDGTPMCWSNRPFRRASPPEGEVLTSISSGRKHICGLREMELPCAGDGTTAAYRHRQKIDLCPSVPEIRTFAVFGKMELLCAGAILTLAV